MRIRILLPTKTVTPKPELKDKDFRDSPKLSEILQVMQSFLDNDSYDSQTKNYSLSYTHCHKPEHIFLYSFRFCIGHIITTSEEKTLYLNMRYYSDVTSNHQHLLKDKAIEQGFNVVESFTDNLDYERLHTNW